MTPNQTKPPIKGKTDIPKETVMLFCGNVFVTFAHWTGRKWVSDAGEEVKEPTHYRLSGKVYEL